MWLRVPKILRTTIGDQAFAITGPDAWNNLPDFIGRQFVIVHFQTISQHLSIQSV